MHRCDRPASASPAGVRTRRRALAAARRARPELRGSGERVAVRAQDPPAGGGPGAGGRGAGASARRAGRAAAGRVRRPTRDGRVVRLLTWLDGRPWADAPGDLAELGRTVARVDKALASFNHPAMHRDHPWKATGVAPGLPHQLIHNDANEHNVLVGEDGSIQLIDFGDVVYSARVAGLAVACAYAMQGQPDPARAVVPIVRGYHEIAPLRPDELEALFGLIVGRLELSVAMAARQSAAAPENEYLLISQAGITAVLARLRERGRAARPLPLPRRVRLRGEPERPPHPAVARVGHAAPRHGRRSRGRAGPGSRRRHAPDRRARDRPLRRAALDLHRARVRDAGRALAHAPHGGRRLRPGGDAGLRAARRGRGTAREPRPAGRLRRRARAPSRGALLDASRPSRP